MATDMPKSAFKSNTMAFYTFLIIIKTKLNMVFIVLAIAVVCISVVYLFASSSDTESPAVTEEPEVVEIERMPPESKSEWFRIAGISHHCSRRDIGMISGEMIDDPKNPHDKDAVMIVEANRTRLLGYIGRDEKSAYRKFADGRKRMPFVGFIEEYITEDGRACLFGVVQSYLGDEETVQKDANNDWEFLEKAFRIRSYEKRMKVLDQFKYR